MGALVGRWMWVRRSERMRAEVLWPKQVVDCLRCECGSWKEGRGDGGYGLALGWAYAETSDGYCVGYFLHVVLWMLW